MTSVASLLTVKGSAAGPVLEWVADGVDRLLRSATMGGLIDLMREVRVDQGILLVLMFAVGLGLGGLLVLGCYAGELGRWTRFLDRRDRRSNARVTCDSHLPGIVGMADAVNAELAASESERVEAQRAADEFARGLSALSHDVRTPLMGARGYLQLAAGEPDAERRAEQLRLADARLAAMGGLLDELFSYARASDPDTPLDLEAVAVRPVIETSLLGHFPEFEERGWEPSVEMDGSAEVIADAEALARIVENLVVNALRHGAGPLCVRVREDAGTERVTLAFSNAVADPSTLDAERLFERFYQADPARSGSGSGLGLAVASELAAAQGMELAAALEGDVLTITLTCRRAG